MEKIAVLIPSYNEEITIKKVINDFKKELPEADIYVYNNNSNDRTYELAKECGAIVRNEYNQGKGNVIRRMFREIDADIYVMVDADNTYPANRVHDLIQPIREKKADMVVGDRLSNGTYKKQNKRAFHGFGNKLVRDAINVAFKSKLNDIMSGYRAFSRFFVKNTPVLSSKFEIETEMTIHALDKRYIIKEIPIEYKERPKGSNSKLNTIGDGIKVIKMIIKMYKDFKPRKFFKHIAMLVLFIAILIGMPVFYEFIKYQYVYKVPSAILSMGLTILSIVIFQCGVILDTLVKQHKEDYELRLIDYNSKGKYNG